MSVISIASILITLCALFAYVNYRFLKLPAAIGIMVLSLVFSVAVLASSYMSNALHVHVLTMMQQVDFTETLLHGMLSFLLFAGALHVDLDDLGKQKGAVSLMAGFSTLFSTAVVGLAVYTLFPIFGIAVPLIYALIFGALISPTDPVAVMAILKKAGASKSLESKVVGESLFNDGVAVVLFLVLLDIAASGSATINGALALFLQEALGGAALGFVLGYITYRMLKSINHYQVEILLTLALVMGGYELARYLHMSGPIAMVIAGLMLGNHGRKFAMSEKTRLNLDNFWELCDEFLNAVLFLLIGLEILLLPYSHSAVMAGAVMIPLLLLIRYVSVFIPIRLLSIVRNFSKNAVLILTWGGLRGGISVALVLSLPQGEYRDILLVVTYCIVVFSIIVQGLTIGKLVEASQEKT